MTCPDLLLLSQLLDGELPPPDGAMLRAHVDACGACRDRLARLDQATAAVHAALAAADSPAAALAPDCLPADRLAGWAARVLPADEVAAAGAHLEGCDACLHEALAAARTLAMLDAGPAAAVPEPLRARVASRWSVAPVESLTALVVRVARAGVTLLERHVVAPVLDVEELLVPAPAVRAADKAGEVLSFRIRAAEAQIRATIVPDGAAVGLSLSLLGADDRALAGQRVFLRRHGRSIYSARTDALGALQLPRIEPGLYEVACPGIATSFRLDLRP